MTNSKQYSYRNDYSNDYYDIKWLFLYNDITLLLESSVHNSIGLHSSL